MMRALRKLLVVEAKLLLRNPIWIFTLVIPLFTLVIFGLSVRGGDSQADLSGLAAVTVTISLALVGTYMVPVTLSTYREKGILRRFSTTPVHPASLLGVQLLLHLVLIGINTAVLVGVGYLVLGLQIPQQMTGFVIVFVLGACALFGIGLVIGSLAPNAAAANGIGVLLYFPMAFFAGLMVPPTLMPAVLVQAGILTPLGAFRQAVELTWRGASAPPAQITVLILCAFLAGLIALRSFRWE